MKGCWKLINHFPTPYPDELLHSTIARYHLRSANYFIRHTMYDVFERNWVSATVYLPSLVSEISRQTNLDTDVLIRKHTMFPFQTSFIKTDQARKIYESMVNDDGRKTIGGCGLMRSKMPINKFIKYCPVCFTEDFEQYGEFYWHCIHQLPGRTICKKHKLWLQDSEVLVQHKNRNAYILPTEQNCDLTKIFPVSEQDFHLHEKLITFVEQLYQNNYSHVKYSFFSDFYRKVLKEKGLLFINDYINWDALFQLFHEKYSNESLEQLHMQLDSNPTWFELFFRKQRISYHPYAHFLILNLFEKNLDDLFTVTYAKGLLWSCVNPSCKQYGIAKLKSYSEKRDNRTIKYFIKCDVCGHHFTETQEHILFQNVGVEDFKEICKHCFLYLLGEGLPMERISKLMHIDTQKLARFQKSLESNNFDTAIKHTKRCRDVDRYRWKKLQKQYPSESKSALRNMENALYTRLKRHDREWLDAHSPLLRQ